MLHGLVSLPANEGEIVEVKIFTGPFLTDLVYLEAGEKLYRDDLVTTDERGYAVRVHR